MRILHTSDWHLGSSLYGHDRTDDLFARVNRICELTKERSVDVLLVVGDIFDRRQVRDMTKRLADTLAPYVRAGLNVIMVPGNHDDREHFRMMRALIALEHASKPEGESQGHVHVVQTREKIEFGGVQFVIIPYPLPEMLEPFRQDETGATSRHMVLSTAFADLVRSAIGSLERHKPAVFVTHINVAGVTTPSDRELTYDEDIRLGRGDLPISPNLSYIALGHIHQSQRIPHSVPCYYSGSIERMNMGERNDQKRVLIVDVPERGPASVEEVPLEASPFYDIRVPAAELDDLPSRFDHLAEAYVRIHLECEAGDDPVALQRQARELMPRCYSVEFSGQSVSTATAEPPSSPMDYAGTVSEYLRQTFADDPDLPELEDRANQLLREVSDAFAAN